MVEHWGFLIRLVEAESKIPFKEHHHEGKTFVEAEPGAEYFIAVSRPRSSELPGTLRLHFLVDGKNLGYCRGISKMQNGTRYFGIRKRENRISTHTGLKFVPPKLQMGPHVAGPSGMGKVEIKIHRSIRLATPRIQSDHTQKSLTPETVGHFEKVKKVVRSAMGSYEVSRPSSSEMSKYGTGALVSTVTLYYCTTPGLIKAGVLPTYLPRLRSGSSVKRERDSVQSCGSMDPTAVVTPPTIDLTKDRDDDEEDTKPPAAKRRLSSH